MNKTILLGLIALSALFSVKAFSLDSGTTDFLILGEKLYLVGVDPVRVTEECHGLGRFAKMYRKRNQSDLQSIPDCTIIEDPTEILQRGHHPSYTYETLRAIESLRPSLKSAVNVSDIIPREIWEFSRNRPREGVCFNSALVDSGLLPTQFRSFAVQSVDYLLGLRSIFVSRSGDNYVMNYGKLSDSPAIQSRFMIEIDPGQKDVIKAELDAVIQSDFSPGSILCIDSGPPEHVFEVQRRYAGQKGVEIDLSLFEHPSLETGYLEKKGGHCLTFLTPHLIADSNQRLPYNLVNWSVAFEYFVDLMKGLDTRGTFFYFKLNPDRQQYARWLQKQIITDGRLKTLLGLAQDHRDFYENLRSWECLGTKQFDLYSSHCLSANDELRLVLTRFWNKRALPILRGVEFDEFWETRRSHSPVNKGQHQLAYEIFTEFLQPAEVLGLFD